MDKRQVKRTLLRAICSLGYEFTNGGVRKEQSIELLLDQFGPLAAQDYLAICQVRLELIK